MTKPELSGTRDLAFSKWLRTSLPDSSTGYSVSDIDFAIWNWQKKKVMLCEVKLHGKEITTGQLLQMRRMARWIQSGLDDGWQYMGWVIVTFEGTGFDDGRVWIRGIEQHENTLVTEAGLRELLSLT